MNEKQLRAENARLRAENKRLRDANATLREAGGIAGAMESLRPLATRAYRALRRDVGDGAPLPDDAPLEKHYDGGAIQLPSIILRLELCGDRSWEWSAQVLCEDMFDDEDAHTLELSLGESASDPIGALENLRDALEEEPGEDGVRVTAAMRATLDVIDRGNEGSSAPSGEKPN